MNDIKYSVVKWVAMNVRGIALWHHRVIFLHILEHNLIMWGDSMRQLSAFHSVKVCMHLNSNKVRNHLTSMQTIHYLGQTNKTSTTVYSTGRKYNNFAQILPT